MSKGAVHSAKRTNVRAIAFLVLLISGCATLQEQHSPQRFAIGVLGDVPYTAADEAKMPALIKQMNEADLAFVVHVGDMQADGAGYKDGAPPCADETFATRKAQIESIRHPVILTPGDNDWSDCHRAKPGSGYDPLERLSKVREMFASSAESVGSFRFR